MKQLIFIFSLFAATTFGQDTIAVWENGIPNTTTAPGEEAYVFKRNSWRYENVTTAEIFVYFPKEEINTGAAVIICPGGGYWIEAVKREGDNIAKYLQSKGITGIVLKYRLPYGNPEVPTSDVQRAIRLVRHNAEKWQINPNKIGIAGSSAGGHLAAFATVHFDDGDANAKDVVEQQSCRPDFSLLLYPVISFREDVGDRGSRDRFMGDATSDWEKVKYYCNELWVSDKTPPSFMVLSDDDHIVIPENSIRYYQALKMHDVPAELHIFGKGGHGYGLQDHLQFRAAKWNTIFLSWLQEMEIIE